MWKGRYVDAITWGRDGHVGFGWGEDVNHGGGGGACDGVCSVGLILQLEFLQGGIYVGLYRGGCSLGRDRW